MWLQTTAKGIGVCLCTLYYFVIFFYIYCMHIMFCFCHQFIYFIYFLVLEMKDRQPQFRIKVAQQKSPVTKGLKSTTPVQNQQTSPTPELKQQKSSTSGLKKDCCFQDIDLKTDNNENLSFVLHLTKIVRVCNRRVNC